MCSFDDYVDIDISASAIHQPNTIGADFVDVDLSATSHNPVYEGLLDGLDEINAVAESPNNVFTGTDKEAVKLNVKTRKFSLQELKSKENNEKKRNKSLPALIEYNSNKELNNGQGHPNIEQSKEESVKTNNAFDGVSEKQNIIRQKEGGINKAKASSFQSVLLEVDEYENIEIINELNKNRTYAKSMNEQQKEQEMPTRRATSEQARAPVPQPRTTLQQKRKTFDPYDYPPGVPIPKETDETEVTEDNEYMPHLPSEENREIRRKTFDPYDYPPGVSIPRYVLEGSKLDGRILTEEESENICKFKTDIEYDSVESSGVYIAYDPEKDQEKFDRSKLDEYKYIDINSETSNENKNNNDQTIQVFSEEEIVKSSLHDHLEQPDDIGPPKPCPVTPYYVNENVPIFDEPNETCKVKDTLQSYPANTDSERDSRDLLVTSHTIDSNETYENCLEATKYRETDILLASDSNINEGKQESGKRSKSEKNIPAAASSDIRRYLSDDHGIYQNILPTKPPRTHSSDVVTYHIDDNIPRTNTVGKPEATEVTGESIENQTDDAYEDVLVKQKQVVKKGGEHEYMNVKRYS